jgi:hypothetical protein
MKKKIQIKIEERLDENRKEWFEGMDISYDGNVTILSANDKDNSFLHGILIIIRDLNLQLISVDIENSPLEKMNFPTGKQ